MSNLFATVDWAKKACIYEVNTRQYTKEGTFESFGKHLPRLKEMGIGILWLMPVQPISKEKRQGELGSYYSVESYTQINPEYGNANDLKLLIADAHSQGLKIIIDWVANHTGYDHHWTKEHSDWYMKDAAGNFTEENGWQDVIDLDYDNKAMRSEMIAAMQYWITEFDIDGFRCDMAHLVPLDFWKDARQQCDSLKPLFWLAECETVEYHDVFDVTYAWNWMHQTEKLIKGQASINDIYNVLHSYSQYPKDSYKMFFTSNHDENSWNGTEYDKYGNAAKALAVFTFTWKGFPMIYSGQEIPNKKQLLFFDKDCLDWTNITMHDFYKTLSDLHQSETVNNGETFILPLQHNYAMGYFKKKDDEVILVLLNFSQDYISISLDHEWMKGSFMQVFSGLKYTFNQAEKFQLSPYEYLVYRSCQRV